MNNILSQSIDTNKIFIVNFMTLEERLDPEFYNKRIDTSNYIKLSKIAQVKGGKRIPLGYDYSAEETNNLYFRVVNIDEYKDIDFSNCKYISDELYLILHRYEIFNNDLIISIAGTIGKIKLINQIPIGKKVILTENCAKIILKNENILPQYFELVLQTSFMQKQIQLGYIQTTIPKLGLDKILNLYFPPIPTAEQQRQLIMKYQEAYQKKQQKEAMADELFAGIDIYLLNELKIALPQKENSLKDRIFVVSFREITENRFDPNYYNYKIQEIKKQFKMKFKECVADLYRYPTFYDISYKDRGIRIIKGENIDRYGNIDLSQDFDFVDIKTHNEFVRTHIKYNDMIFTVRGIIGKVGIYKSHEPANINANVMRISLKSSVNPDFYWNYLNSSVGQILINSLSSGQVQKTITVKDILNIPVPFPPLTKQNQIANYIQKIRIKAKNLQEEAQNILEQAKNEVEQIILGEQ